MGGCHSQAGRYCRSSNRYYHTPETRSSQIGFRPVLTKLHLDGLHQLTDGRILVRSNPPNQELGYYLMTPDKDGTPKFERIQCDLASKGVLDRISLSPSETRFCFEFQTGFERGVPGRTLYVADFDAKQPAITGAKPFANEDEKPIWYAYPRWSKDESAIIYQADEKLYLYNFANKSTTKASTRDATMKRAPK